MMLLTLISFGWLAATGCAAPVAESLAAPPCDSAAQLDRGAVAAPVLLTARATLPAFPPSRLIEPAHSADEFVNSIGINTHLSYFRTPYGTGWATFIKPKLVALGVRHLRDGGNVVDDDNWMQLVYGRMKELADQGMRFNLIMGPPKGSDDYSRLPQFGRLMQYAAPVVESFEGLNEHDLSRRPDWVNDVRVCQQALYTAVKGDPRSANMPVYGPSMGRAASGGAVGDLSQFMDYGNLHPYPGGKPPLTNLADHRTRTSGMNGSRPLVATETGYHTALQWTGGHPPVSEAAMARYVPRLFLEYFNAGIRRTYLYELVDEGSDRAQREQNFGLLRVDGSEKPAFTALRNLIAILRDPGPAFTPGNLDYTLAGDTTGVRHLLLARRDGRFLLVLWQDTTTFDTDLKVETAASDRGLTLQLPAARAVRLFNPATAVTPIASIAAGTSIPLRVPDGVLVVEIGA